MKQAIRLSLFALLVIAPLSLRPAPVGGFVLLEQERVFPAEEWQRAAPDSQGLDASRLQATLEYLDAHSGSIGTDETVLVRNGYLIWSGPKADAVHEIYSCTKTFTSTVLGLLASDGVLRVDDPAVLYLPGLDDEYPDYERITLAQLASMSSGYSSIRGDGWSYYRTDRARHHQHVLSYTTPGPPDYPAGSSFRYHDPAVHLLGHILTRVSRKPLKTVFRQRVADRIGMKAFDWSDYGERDGLLLNNPAGTPGENQGGVRSSALDLARFGLLYLSGGNWRGEQILSESFVERATSNQVPASLETRYFDLTGRYGFFWWTNGVRADGTRPWPAAPAGTYAAVGASRNYLFVIPEWNMVLVRMCPAAGGRIDIDPVPRGVWQEFFVRLRTAVRSQ